MFTGMIFVASSAFNNMGKPVYSTMMTWLRDGLVMLPAVFVGASKFGAIGVVYMKVKPSIPVTVILITWDIIDPCKNLAL